MQNFVILPISIVSFNSESFKIRKNTRKFTYNFLKKKRKINKQKYVKIYSYK